MTKVAIVTRPEYRSPRILAESLDGAIRHSHKATSEIFFDIKAFKRLLPYFEVKHKYPFLVWIAYKWRHYFKDRLFIRKLKSYDVVIISDCAPMGFYKETYDIERLKSLLEGIPVVLYEVYFLGNAPTQINNLKKIDAPGIDRFDWYLSVSEVTEIRQRPIPPWSQIGLRMSSTNLKPLPKKGFLAIIDFPQPGYETFRDQQIQVLEELGIPYICFDREYTIEEIRSIYQQATFYFMQSSEAFGLPIVECLCCGTYIFTPDSSWPMSWRMDDHPEVHGPGQLPDCFVLYKNTPDLKDELQEKMSDYHFEETPKKVFQSFYQNYPTFYDGNEEALIEFIDLVAENKILTS